MRRVIHFRGERSRARAGTTRCSYITKVPLPRAAIFLPHAVSVRRDNPTAVPSRFGGLWVDQPNARDIVAGRLGNRAHHP